MDDFNTLSNRLLTRVPKAGIMLAQQWVNDSWQTLQSMREWSWRRRFGTIAPPNLYATGTVSTNVGVGLPTTLTGIGTSWTQDMIGRQIRIGGLMYPYYTIIGWNSATSIEISAPWAGPDVTHQTYTMLKIYYDMPSDFGYFYYVVSIKDAYRLWINVTENDLAMMDPQRTNTGQTYAIAFRGYNDAYGGSIGPVMRVSGSGDSPVSTTSYGYTFVTNATYVVQVVTGGVTGVATFQWMRAGQTSFTGPVLSTEEAQDLMDGVMLYWPTGNTYVANDVFIVNCLSQVTESAPQYEMWPAPTFNGYLYPYCYIAKEYALTTQQPKLPPFIANRGEVLLEMALVKAAEWPGSDEKEPNPYFSLALAKRHQDKSQQLIWDLERNDEEVGVTNITYQTYPLYPAPWLTGSWQQSHAPFLNG